MATAASYFPGAPPPARTQGLEHGLLVKGFGCIVSFYVLILAVLFLIMMLPDNYAEAVVNIIVLMYYCNFFQLPLLVYNPSPLGEELERSLFCPCSMKCLRPFAARVHNHKSKHRLPATEVLILAFQIQDALKPLEFSIKTAYHQQLPINPCLASAGA